MNCPQCQTANGPDSAFCGNCGARLAVAETAVPAAGYAPQGTGEPLGYAAPGGYAAPTGYGAPAGYNSSGGYNPGTPQQPAGYPQGQYQQSAPGGYAPPRPASSVPPVNFDLSRLTTVDKVVAVASLIALISIWLPWFTVTASDNASGLGIAGGTASQSGSALDAHGAWMWLVFLVALALVAYLVARAAWDRLPFGMPAAHATLLMIGTGVLLLFMLISFLDIPSVPSGVYDGVSGLSISVGWAWGAFIGLLAALAAAGPVLVPPARSYLQRRGVGGSRSL